MMDEKDVHAGILVSGLMRPRGWLLVLCALLLVWQPLSLGLTIAGLLERLGARGAGLATILLARLVAAGLGIAAGLALSQVRPAAVSLAKTSLVVSAFVDLLVYATPFSPDNRPPGDATIVLGLSFIYYGAWFLYLVRSKRVRAMYP